MMVAVKTLADKVHQVAKAIMPDAQFWYSIPSERNCILSSSSDLKTHIPDCESWKGSWNKMRPRSERMAFPILFFLDMTPFVIREKRFKENDCIYGRIETATEVTTDPQALANDFFAKLHHPVGVEMRLVNTPVKFQQNPASVRNPAPEVGQHTEETLLNLGYSWDDIGTLKEQGVIL